MWCDVVSCDVVSCDVMSCDPLWNSSSSLLFYTYWLTDLLTYLLTYWCTVSTLRITMKILMTRSIRSRVRASKFKKKCCKDWWMDGWMHGWMDGFYETYWIRGGVLVWEGRNRVWEKKWGISWYLFRTLSYYSSDGGLVLPSSSSSNVHVPYSTRNEECSIGNL